MTPRVWTALLIVAVIGILIMVTIPLWGAYVPGVSPLPGWHVPESNSPGWISEAWLGKTIEIINYEGEKLTFEYEGQRYQLRVSDVHPLPGENLVVTIKNVVYTKEGGIEISVIPVQ